MSKQLPHKDDAQTPNEADEARRINSLPPTLQTLAVSHHLDQWRASPSYVEAQAANFVAFCDALGIHSISEDE